MPCSSQIFLLENPNLESQPVQQRGCLTRIWTYGWNYSTHLNVYRLWEIRDENSASFRELVSRFVLVFTNTNTSIFLFDTVHLFFNVLGAQKRRDKLVKGYEQRTNRTKWTNIHTRTLITYPGVSANVTRESIGGRGRGGYLRAIVIAWRHYWAFGTRTAEVMSVAVIVLACFMTGFVLLVTVFTVYFVRKDFSEEIKDNKPREQWYPRAYIYPFWLFANAHLKYCGQQHFSTKTCGLSEEL